MGCTGALGAVGTWKGAVSSFTGDDLCSIVAVENGIAQNFVGITWMRYGGFQLHTLVGTKLGSGWIGSALKRRMSATFFGSCCPSLFLNWERISYTSIVDGSLITWVALANDGATGA